LSCYSFNQTITHQPLILEGFAKAINTNKIKAKNTEKAQFTVVNEHFEAFFNEDIGSRIGFPKASSIQLTINDHY
jgi:hypothetical protein